MIHKNGVAVLAAPFKFTLHKILYELCVFNIIADKIHSISSGDLGIGVEAALGIALYNSHAVSQRNISQIAAVGGYVLKGGNIYALELCELLAALGKNELLCCACLCKNAVSKFIGSFIAVVGIEQRHNSRIGQIAHKVCKFSFGYVFVGSELGLVAVGKTYAVFVQLGDVLLGGIALNIGTMYRSAFQFL